MKQLALLLTILVVVGCTARPTESPQATYQAIYLVQEGGQLSKEDLQAHPEVMVTGSFEEFKRLAGNKAALWIDINAVGLVDKDWLKQKSESFYPIVLIGNSDALCSFRDTLGNFGMISGPPADCSSPPPGFSVWLLEKENSSGMSALMRGYEQAPTVKDILDITNPLLSRQPAEPTLSPDLATGTAIVSRKYTQMAELTAQPMTSLPCVIPYRVFSKSFAEL